VNAAEAALLGVVQGLTEFLPVSSTAHLLLVQEGLGVNAEGLDLEIATHLGTVLAVAVYYRSLFVSLARDAVRGGPGRRLVLLVGLATLMLGVVGAVRAAFPAVKDWRDDVSVVPWGLGLVGIFMIATAFVRRGSAEPSVVSSVGMGLGQCAAAIVTGCSRSGSTIGSGLFLGIEPASAARFSFLMSVPAVLLGTAAEVREHGLPATDRAGALLVAGTFAFVSGLLAIHAMLRLVGRGNLWWFGPYCIALAVAVRLVV